VSWADGARSHSFGTRVVAPGLITLPTVKPPTDIYPPFIRRHADLVTPAPADITGPVGIVRPVDITRPARQFTALREFTLNGTDHATHREQASMIRRYIAWRNRHTADPRLRRIMQRASTA